MPIPQPPLRSVLIVEDEPRLRSTLEEMVAVAGYDASAVGSAERALRLLEEQAFSVVLLDLNRPGMSGMKLFERLHRERHDLAVIILTGFGDLAVAQQAIHLDVVDFLTKPCHMGDLEAALARAWSRVLGRMVTSAGQPPPPPTPADDESLDEIERRHILAALERHGNNRRATADAIGISLRTLYYRLAQYAHHESSAASGGADTSGSQGHDD